MKVMYVCRICGHKYKYDIEKCVQPSTDDDTGLPTLCYGKVKMVEDKTMNINEFTKEEVEYLLYVLSTYVKKGELYAGGDLEVMCYNKVKAKLENNNEY